MGIFDLLSDAKDNMDKSRQAREYLQRAKELIREGDDIYERAYSKVTSYAYDTEYQLRQHINYKKEIAQELGGSIQGTLSEFSSFNIDAKTITAPSIEKATIGLNDSTGLSSFKTAMSTCMPRIDVPSIFDMFISDNDYYEAKCQRDEARRYKERMKMEREKLYSYREKMSEVRSFIDSEKAELRSLMDKLKQMTGELKSGMQKNSFSISEAEYLKGIHKIAECIVSLLSTEFLGDGFYINKRYQKAFTGIKNINQSLPYAPSISDRTTADAIKKILDGTIMY